METFFRAVGVRLGPLGEQLVAHLPQLREEAVLHALGEQLRRLALERRRAGADLTVHEREVPLPPPLQVLIEVDQRLAEIEQLAVRIGLLVDLPERHAALLEQARHARPHLVGELQRALEAGRLLTGAAPERVADGLPETLEEVAATHGHRYWKLKVAGDVAADIDRLCRIASVLDGLPGYHATFDGNEQYSDAEEATALWRAMLAEPRLARLAASVLYIEQPVRRARALETGIAVLAAARPVIIDESDGTLDAFVQAKALGYAGVSSKSCKGVWRSLVNLARCRAWNAAEKRERYFMSAEDLTTLAGVCVQQDLALVSLMGLPHVERNGHHFVDGFAGRPKAEAVRFMESHPDIYADTPRGPRLAIRDGAIEIGSLATPGLGATAEPDYAAMEPMPKADWR